MRRTLIDCACAAAIVAAFPAGALARAGDTNHDGLPDRWETRHHLSPKINQSRRDPDRDGPTNRAEFTRGTNPRRADTDRDSLTDGVEVRTRNDPLSRHRRRRRPRRPRARRRSRVLQRRDAHQENEPAADDTSRASDETACAARDLAVGTPVHAASLRAMSGGLTFEEVQLVA